jgi:hypothetical protein
VLKCLRILIVTTILLSPVLIIESRAQNYIGMTGSDIISNMDKSMQGFTRQKDVVNENFNYLKYESNDGLQTLLFFLGQKNRCVEVRLIFDKSLYSEKVKHNDDNYTKVGENRWTEKKGRKVYSITMTDDEWFYTVKIRETGKQE